MDEPVRSLTSIRTHREESNGTNKIAKQNKTKNKTLEGYVNRSADTEEGLVNWKKEKSESPKPK